MPTPFAPPRPFRARVIAGMDEAGLGPILGPLVIGCTAFQVEDSGHDLVRALPSVLSDDIATDADRLVVADSKVVFTHTPRGKRRLERTALAFSALAFSALADERAEVADEALGFLAQTRAEFRLDALAREPWHAELAGLRLAADSAHGLRAACAAVRVELGRARIVPLLAATRVIPVAILNESFARTGNKSATQWEHAAVFLAALWRDHAPRGLDLVVDRLGGRMRHAGLLASLFPSAHVQVLLERPARSEYRVRDAERDMRIVFAERAESLSSAVAIASCLAKYARELCMDAQNAWFKRAEPGLTPTAGYYTDGRRWLAEAAPVLRRLGLDPATLVRTR